MTKQVQDMVRLSLSEVLAELGIRDLATGTTREAADIGAVCSVGLTGDLSGYLLISSDLASAGSLVREMAAGMEGSAEEGFGPFGRAAFGELGNQVAGRSIMHLSESGFDCNITPPTVITGQEVHYGLPDADVFFSFSASGAFGNLDCSVNLRRRKDR